MDFINTVLQATGTLVSKLFLLIVVILVVTVAPQTVRHYADLTVGSLEQQIRTIESLENLEQSDLIKQNNDLRLAHNKTKREFMEHIREEHSLSAVFSRIWNNKLNYTNFILKFILPATPYMFLMLLVGVKRSTKRKEQLITLVALSASFGASPFLLGIPEIKQWVVRVAFLVIASVVSVFLYKRWVRK